MGRPQLVIAHGLPMVPSGLRWLPCKRENCSRITLYVADERTFGGRGRGEDHETGSPSGVSSKSTGLKSTSAMMTILSRGASQRWSQREEEVATVQDSTD